MNKANPIRIFIAEDESIILMSFKLIVERIGHQVAGIAANGEKALSEILAVKPDLILLDINMPKLDGISVLREVNAVNPTACIFITGHLTNEFLQKASEAGALGYLIKPVDEKQLKAAIDIAVSRFDDLSSLKAETAVLKTALEDRKLVERAKGILMDNFALKESEAMERLQKMSRDRNKKLSVIAREVIQAEQMMLR